MPLMHCQNVADLYGCMSFNRYTDEHALSAQNNFTTNLQTWEDPKRTGIVYTWKDPMTWMTCTHPAQLRQAGQSNAG